MARHTWYDNPPLQSLKIANSFFLGRNHLDIVDRLQFTPSRSGPTLLAKPSQFPDMASQHRIRGRHPIHMLYQRQERAGYTPQRLLNCMRGTGSRENCGSGRNGNTLRL